MNEHGAIRVVERYSEHRWMWWSIWRVSQFNWKCATIDCFSPHSPRLLCTTSQQGPPSRFQHGFSSHGKSSPHRLKNGFFLSHLYAYRLQPQCGRGEPSRQINQPSLFGKSCVFSRFHESLSVKFNDRISAHFVLFLSHNLVEPLVGIFSLILVDGLCCSFFLDWQEATQRPIWCVLAAGEGGSSGKCR